MPSMAVAQSERLLHLGSTLRCIILSRRSLDSPRAEESRIVAFITHLRWNE